MIYQIMADNNLEKFLRADYEELINECSCSAKYSSGACRLVY